MRNRRRSRSCRISGGEIKLGLRQHRTIHTCGLMCILLVLFPLYSKAPPCNTQSIAVSSLHYLKKKLLHNLHIRIVRCCLNHIAYEQITGPFSAFAVSFVTFLRFGVFGVSKCHPAGLFKNVENRNPVFP